MKKLIIYLCILGVIAWPIWTIFHKAQNQIHFVYLDPYCKPVTGAELKITEVKRDSPWYLFWTVFLGYPVMPESKVYRHQVTTDDNGYFNIQKEGNISLRIYRAKDWDLSTEGKNYLRSFSEDEIHLMTHSSKDNPISIYSQSHRPAEAIRYQSKQQSIARYNYGGNKTVEHIISIGGNSSDVVAKIYMTEKADRFDFKIYAAKGGGLIAVKKENLPFNAQLPQQGWQDNLKFSITRPLPWPQTQQHYFYFKSFDGKGYGTLTLDHSFPERQPITNVFIDGVLPAYKGTPIHNPVVFQESCGGILARHYDGYYGHIQLSEFEQKKLEDSVSDEMQQKTVQIVSSREDMAPIARDINTPLSWYQQHAAFSQESANHMDTKKVNAGFLAIEALNNNGPIIDRIEWLYQSYRPHAEKQLKDYPRGSTNFSAIAVMVRIAEDPRTPAAILQEIYKSTGNSFAIIKALVKNPGLPKDVADNIAQVFLEKALAAKQQPHMQRASVDNQLQYYIRRNKSVGTETFNKVIQATSHLPWGFTLTMRDERASFSTLKMLANLDNQMVSAEDKEVWQRIQQNPELKPYHRHFPLKPVENRFTPPDQLEQLYYSDSHSHYHLGRNPATPKAILELLCDRKTKHLYKALVQNPNTSSECLTEAYYSKLLSRSSQEDVASNPNTPGDLLIHMVDQVQSGYLTPHVAANPNAPLELLERLSKGNFIVTDRYLTKLDHALYCNPSTPDIIKLQLPYYMNTHCK